MASDPISLGGKIRVFPSDFIVEEVWSDRLCTIGYSVIDRFRDRFNIKFSQRKKYLRFVLVKEDWETIRALNYIARKIHASEKSFGISGMKDKKAITSQFVSLWKGKADVLSSLRLPDMILKNFKYSDERINLGNAVGNLFTITLRDIPKKRDEIARILSKFKDEVLTRGVPNYFGPQRLSGGNADVGEAIKKSDLKMAIQLILEKVQPYLKEGAIENIPKVFWYEKKMLYHLKNLPNDYAGALRLIPKRILRLYTHSYQSRVFNDLLKRYIQEKTVPPTIVVPGFEIAKMPELQTFPIERRSYLIAKNFKIQMIKDGLAMIRFTLGKGDYATTLLSHLV